MLSEKNLRYDDQVFFFSVELFLEDASESVDVTGPVRQAKWILERTYLPLSVWMLQIDLYQMRPDV